MKYNGALENVKEDLDCVDKGIFLGVFYGYPECCIKTFVRMNIDLPRDNNPFRGTGFLCCSQCISKPINNIVKVINNQRYCSVKFSSNKDELNDNMFHLIVDENHPENSKQLFNKIKSNPYEINIDWDKVVRIHNEIYYLNF
ncbi:hypothetical protein PBI_SCTP2_234 [Salicola phage SCTP-2]|nr:hypothetical protein PBI_SCTP2_234 [Salicola phage SCTP-2]